MIKSASRSSITSNEKYRSMSVGNVPSAEFLIQTVEVGATPVATVSFDVSAFAGVYKHLQIVAVARDTNAENERDATILFNADTNASNYRTHGMFGGFTSSVNVFNSVGLFTSLPGGSFASGAFGAVIIDILDPFSISKNTTIRMLRGYTSASFNRVTLASGAYFNTSAIASISIAAIGNFATGSRLSLYGVTA